MRIDAERGGALVPDTVPWQDVWAEFAARDLTTVTREIQRRQLDLTAVDLADPAHVLSRGFGDLWLQAAAAPAGTSRLIAFWVYARAQVEWELSIHYAPVTARLRGAYQAWLGGAARDRLCAEEHCDVEVMLQHGLSLPAAMQAENALNCSDPGLLQEHAGRVADDSDRLLRTLAAAPGDETAFRRGLRVVLHRHQVTYEAVRRTASAVGAAAEGGTGVIPLLEDAADRLRVCEQDLGEDVYASELRAHRSLLHALADRLRDPEVPDLALDEVRLVYVYPFRLPPAEADAPALADSSPPGAAAGVRARELWSRPDSGEGPHVLVTELQLSDIWSLSHKQQPVYAGTVLKLPDLELTSQAGALSGRYSVEVRLNEPGNHYVRIASGPRHDLSLHELYQGLRRGSLHMGQEPMATHVFGPGGGLERRERGWRVAEYAEELTASLARALRDGQPEVPTDPSRRRRVLDVDQDAHVLLEVREASVRTGDGTRPATAEDLRLAAGRLIWQPVQIFASALEEWLLLPVPPVLPNILGPAARHEDLGLSSNSLTVLYLPDTPSWKFLGYEEMVEFSATIPCLARSWVDDLEDMANDILRGTRPLDAGRAPTDAALEQHERDLHEDRLTLSRTVVAVRGQRERLGRVQSPAYRTFLRNLLTEAGVPQYDEGLRERFAQLDVLSERLAQQVRYDREQRNSRYQRRTQAVLTVLTILSVTGLFSLFNALLLSSPAAWHWAASEAVLLVAFVVMAYWWTRRGTGEPRRQGSSDR